MQLSSTYEPGGCQGNDIAPLCYEGHHSDAEAGLEHKQVTLQGNLICRGLERHRRSVFLGSADAHRTAANEITTTSKRHWYVWAAPSGTNRCLALDVPSIDDFTGSAGYNALEARARLIYVAIFAAPDFLRAPAALSR